MFGDTRQHDADLQLQAMLSLGGACVLWISQPHVLTSWVGCGCTGGEGAVHEREAIALVPKLKCPSLTGRESGAGV